MSEATELIREGLGVIRHNGWTRFIRMDQEGRVCALGALDAALLPQAQRRYISWEGLASNDDDPVHQRAAEILARNIPDSPPSRRSSYQQSLSYECQVADYNNSLKLGDQALIEEWFEKAAADERVD